MRKLLNVRIYEYIKEEFNADSFEELEPNQFRKVLRSLPVSESWFEDHPDTVIAFLCYAINFAGLEDEVNDFLEALMLNISDEENVSKTFHILRAFPPVEFE